MEHLFNRGRAFIGALLLTLVTFTVGLGTVLAPLPASAYTTDPRGGKFIRQNYLMSVALTPTAVSTSSAEQTFTVPNVQVGDFVDVSKPTAQANLAIGNARVTAANTIGITYLNFGAATVTPTAETYLVKVSRP